MGRRNIFPTPIEEILSSKSLDLVIILKEFGKLFCFLSIPNVIAWCFGSQSYLNCQLFTINSVCITSEIIPINMHLLMQIAQVGYI